MRHNPFTRPELRELRRIGRPEKIQKFLDDLPYNHHTTCMSPRRVLRDGTAHCMEGALLAAAALWAAGHPPLLLDLEAVRDDDHVLAVFRERGLWGAVAKSNYSGLRFREPVYRSTRELVMSYFEHYYNLKGEKTLRRYSRPVNLLAMGTGWMVDEADVWSVPERLCSIAHRDLLRPASVRRLRQVDARLWAAGLLGSG